MAHSTPTHATLHPHMPHSTLIWQARPRPPLTLRAGVHDHEAPRRPQPRVGVAPPLRLPAGASPTHRIPLKPPPRYLMIPCRCPPDTPRTPHPEVSKSPPLPPATA
eukprot:6773579-Prymnesium_polylepis.1